MARTLIFLMLIGPLAVVAAAAQEPPAPSSAQEAPPPLSEADPVRQRSIEEIIVTAERRESYLQDTPISISAFSGAELDAAGIEGPDDLAFNVPNLHYGRTLGGPNGGGGGVTTAESLQRAATGRPASTSTASTRTPWQRSRA
jgi:outer membrane receptor protein involved in Fe transport